MAVASRRARVAPYAADLERGLLRMPMLVFGCVDLLREVARFDRVAERGGLRNDAADEGLEIAMADVVRPHPDIEVFPDPKTARTKYGAYGQTFHREFSGDKKLTGNQRLHFEIIVGGENGSVPRDLAEADRRAAQVSIDFTGHEPKKQAELSARVAAAGNEAFKSNFSLPKPGRMHTAALAKQAEAMTRRTGKNIVAVKVIFTDVEWGIER